MKPLVIAVLIAAVFIIVCIVFSVYQDRKLKAYLTESYGKERPGRENIKYRLGLIEQLYMTDCGDLPDEDTIDDITWNDLNMDEIYSRIDHTDSYAGEQVLYSRLRCPFAADREGFEKKIKLFDSSEQKRSSVRKKLYSLGKNTIDYDLPLIAGGLSYLRIKATPFCAVLLCVLLGTGITALILRSTAMFTVFACVYFFNMLVYICLKQRSGDKIKLLFGIGKALNTANSITEEVPELENGIKEKLSKLRPAMRISSFLERKISSEKTDDMSMFTAYILGPFMIDMLLFDRLLNKLTDRYEECIAVYRYLGDIDAAIAVGSYRRSLDGYCVPSVCDKDSFSFEGLVHPLIDNAVENDIAFERNIIITGSNASGKSTFVKAAAVNLLLGQTINTCTAKAAVIPRCGIITSMAVKDDVISGDSYYIREIKYLRRMVELCERGKLLFLAVDEILKGTNTRERIAASKAILDYLDAKRCMLMTATHDMELAETFDGRFDNIYFSENFKADDVEFDYKLHKGISHTSNAIKLLSVIGFPDTIIEHAESLKNTAPD